MWGVQCLLGPQGVQKLDLVAEVLREGRAPPHCQHAMKKERMEDKHPGPQQPLLSDGGPNPQVPQEVRTQAPSFLHQTLESGSPDPVPKYFLP